MFVNENLHTRREASEDREFRYQVYASSRAEEVSGWGWTSAELDAFLRMQFQAQQSSFMYRFKTSLYQIIEFEQQPAGHILVVDGSGELLLADIALLPAYRNRGIGGRLIRHLQDTNPDKSIKLQVVVSNPARRLYERLGFHVITQDGLHLQMQWNNASVGEADLINR